MHSERTANAKDHAAAVIDSLHEQAVGLSDWLHANPEPSFEEFAAVNTLCEVLSESGFHVEIGVADLETSFHASYVLDGSGPHVAFLAEYDALPELGHACGHNLIAAASLTAAMATKQTMETYQIPGTVSVFGTPGQELYSGKAAMVNAGCFDGIDAAMLVHPNDQNILDPVSMALVEFEASFRGISAHAAEAPYEGKNALNAVLVMFRAVDALRQHIRPDVRIHGIITEGGRVAGLVPDFAQARFACRAEDRKTLDEISRRVRKCAEAAALATETDLEVHEFEPRVDSIIHDPGLAALFRSNWELSVDSIERGRNCASMGALDTGNVSHVVPTIQPMIAAVPGGVRHHTPAFAAAMREDLAHEALRIAGRTLAMTGIDVLAQSPTHESVHGASS